MVNAQFRLQQINARALPYFEKVEGALGRDFAAVNAILWGEELGARISGIFRNTLETGMPYVSPLFSEMRRDLGEERSYEWQTQRVSLPDGAHGVACYFRDVTETARTERSLHEAKDAAEAANRSKDLFLAVLSHELRTPLTPVLMAVGAMEHTPALPEEVREDIKMIKRNVELETKLIDDLLDVSRISSGKVELRNEPVDLNDAVRHVCGICRPQLGEHGVRLETDFDERVGWIVADSARLQQVIWNVLKNAIKFTKAQGVVWVSTVRLGTEWCEVRVRDSGIGIAPEMLGRIFNAFDQGETHITRQFGGLGLGLAISRALVELQGGTIRAESDGIGRGAMFIIRLPGETAPEDGGQDAQVPTERVGRPVRVLLVEDHSDTARTLARLLRASSFEVIHADSVAKAIATAEREEFDVVVSDLGLPDGDGCQIMRTVRARHPVPGIAMSGFGMEEDIAKSRESGFREHLVKPINITQMVAAIERAMSGE